MDVLADERDKRVLQAAPEREVGVEEVGRPEAARGQEDALAHDAPVRTPPRMCVPAIS